MVCVSCGSLREVFCLPSFLLMFKHRLSHGERILSFSSYHLGGTEGPFISFREPSIPLLVNLVRDAAYFRSKAKANQPHGIQG